MAPMPHGMCKPMTYSIILPAACLTQYQRCASADSSCRGVRKFSILTARNRGMQSCCSTSMLE